MSAVTPNFKKTLGLWALLIGLMFFVYRTSDSQPPARLDGDDLVLAAQEDAIDRILVELKQGQGEGRVYMRDDRRFTTGRLPMAEFTALQKLGVAVVFSGEEPDTLKTLVLQWVPLLLVLAFFMYFLRQFRGASGKAGDLLKFEPALLEPAGPVTLQGLTEARAALLAAAKNVQAGSPGPRRVLLTGAPGTGKTALIKALAADSGLPCFALSGSQFVEVFVGTGATRLRKVFEAAQAKQPCLIAIDDVDAFASRRRLVEEPAKAEQAGQVDERSQTLLELTNRLDGLVPFPKQVLFVCTSSRPDLLDEALTRPGRIELRVELLPGGASSVVATLASHQAA